MAKVAKDESTLGMNFLDNVRGLLDNEFASVVDEGTYADFAGFIDTGSYALNALYSGSIYGGIPSNKISALAGLEATGKTFFLLSIIKHFLDSDPRAIVVLFETEGAINKQMLAERKLDTKRILMVGVETAQQFKTQCLRVVNNHLAIPEKERRPMLIGLDSLGMLSTSKEMADSESGKEVKDMTRTQEIKAAFRTLTLKLSKANIPMVITNHVYTTMGLFPTLEVSGGGGLKFAASNIVALGKSQDKDGDGELVGIFIRCKNMKSRTTREKAEVKVSLSFDRGLDRYFGLLDIAIEEGILKKISAKVEFPDGTTAKESTINKNPTKFFTKELLDQIDLACKAKFLYGSACEQEVLDEILNPEDTEEE